MVNYCEVEGCRSQKLLQKQRSIGFFSLPKDPERRKKWLVAIDRLDLMEKNHKSHFVCERHFHETKIKYIPQLVNDAVPIKILPKQPSTSDEYSQTEKSYKNLQAACSKDPDVNSLRGIEIRKTKFNNKNNYYTQTLALETDAMRKRKLCDGLTTSDPKRIKLINELNNIREKVQLKYLACYANFTFKCEEELCQKLLKILQCQSRQNNSNGNRNFMLFALKFYISSPQTYRFLQKFLRLPSEARLQSFNMLIPLKFEDRILNLLSAKLKSLPEKAKYCTLCINQMVLKPYLYYDTKSSEMVGLHNINGKVSIENAKYACVLMLRGIAENWQQPIAYSFLASLKQYKELEAWIDEIIVKLDGIGIKVEAIVSAQASNFNKYAKEVKKVTPQKPYFRLNDKKIYYIFDVPHLMKSIRNNLIANDFMCDGNQISWKHIEEMFDYQRKKHLRIIPKVTQKHVRPGKFQKMQVKFSAQIFSRSVSSAIEALYRWSDLPKEAKHTADFVQKMNNIFDVLNFSKNSLSNQYQIAFSLKQSQTDTLEEAANVFKHIKAIDRLTAVKTTKGTKTFKNILITIKAILMLRQDLEEKGIQFLFTRRLNQEPLTKCFATIRRQAGNNKNPTPVQFKRAFSKLFFSNLTQTSQYSHCQEDIEKVLKKINLF